MNRLLLEAGTDCANLRPCCSQKVGEDNMCIVMRYAGVAQISLGLSLARALIFKPAENRAVLQVLGRGLRVSVRLSPPPCPVTLLISSSPAFHSAFTHVFAALSSANSPPQQLSLTVYEFLSYDTDTNNVRSSVLTLRPSVHHLGLFYCTRKHVGNTGAAHRVSHHSRPSSFKCGSSSNMVH